MQIKRTVLMFAASALSTVGVFQMSAASGYEPLNSRIYHVAEVDFADHARNPANAFLPLDKSSVGKRFLELFPVSTIKSIEVPGDEVDSPTGLIVSAFDHAHFEVMPHTRSYLETSPGKITLIDGRCFKFNILYDEANEHISGLSIDHNNLKLENLPKYNGLLPKLHKGMSRAELQSQLGIDGGISAPFKYERYVVANSKCSEKGDVVKFNLAFKPAGMTDAVYLLGKWVPPKQSPKDVLMRFSLPYIEPAFYD